jgi:predicted HD superfamily hydrolase involved in NAD metabolism
MQPRTLPTAMDVLIRLEQVLPEETLQHSVRTATFARQLAERHGVDPDRVEIAALLHDIADGYSGKELLALAGQFEIPLTLTLARVPKLLHAAVGAEILRRDWDIDDDEILDAVRDHVTGPQWMGPLSKVLFVADKLEPERDHFYGGLEPIRELAMEDLDQAVLRLYAWRMSDLVAHELPVDDRLVSARNRLIEQTLGSRR